VLRRYFAWARQRKLILIDPARTLRLGAQPAFTGTILDADAQRRLFRRWTSATTHPHERLTGLLALLHAASNAQIRGLIVTSIDTRHRTLALARRPLPAPADPATWTAVQACLAHRNQLATLNPHVIVTSATRTGDQPADGSYLTRRLASAAPRRPPAGKPGSPRAEQFTAPAQVNHRRYEALRAFFVDGLSYAQAGARFGYTRWAMVSLVREFRAGKLELFAPPRRPGPPPGTAPARDRARGRVIELRRQGLSTYEISARLAAEGKPLNRTSVGQILAALRARLPRRNPRRHPAPIPRNPRADHHHQRPDHRPPRTPRLLTRPAQGRPPRHDHRPLVGQPDHPLRAHLNIAPNQLRGNPR
jgi:hypothetical protein